jgi:hypothetical protein
MPTKIFYFLIISLISCKQQNDEKFNFEQSIIDTVSLTVKSEEFDKDQKVLKRRIVSEVSNTLVDSVYFFGKRFHEKDVVDSFIIFSKNKIEQKIIIKKDEDGFGEYDFFLPDVDQNVFRNFNADRFPDLVFNPVAKAISQLSWSVIYLFNPISNSYELAEHLALDGLEYVEKNKEYVQKMKDGLGSYSLTRYRLHQKNSKKLIAYETYNVEHNYNDNKFQKNFLIEYDNADTKVKYRDTCLIKMADCKIKYISCDKKIFKKLMQVWIDYYSFKNGITLCPEMDL